MICVTVHRSGGGSGGSSGGGSGSGSGLIIGSDGISSRLTMFTSGKGANGLIVVFEG